MHLQPQLSTDRDGVASLWKFKKIELTANSVCYSVGLY
jgi:hypothetical protein